MVDIGSFEKKYDRKIREVVILFASVIIFPFRTIRALIWQWNFWLQKMDAKIKSDHDDYYKI